VVATASAFSVEQFIDSAGALFSRYARLGLALMGVYFASGVAYFGVLLSSDGEGWLMTGALTVAFVAWITIVNLLYLLMQIAIAAEDCSVMAAVPRVSAFLHRERRSIAAVFLVVLALVVGASGASVLAMGALGLIGFVPLFGLIVLPLELLAWVLRAVVFQYIGLSSIAAYLTLYRETQIALAADRATDASRATRQREPGVNAAEVS
jgi:hypothetical protein